ncbi:T9SS type A sorting domain-containing protein [uncultured Polaribacter sp.]|uniref:T9SS type A sorting domain-containing protein n=1 Tax=uncultured Polaribacter sp. TaxID=174711 RepID=UPI00262F393D|nr:T9SS type A sorting domain-containing protein [uncultured Polaribacter sp.]
MKSKITILLLLFISISFSQTKEKLDYKSESQKSNSNYFDILNKKRAEIKTYDLSKLSDKKEIKQFYRWASFWKDRVDASGQFPTSNLGYFNAGILNEKGKIAVTKLSQKKSTENWVNIGPQDLPDENGYSNPPQMGRLNCFLRIKHPTNRALDILFVGAPSGGIWKSIDGGTTWLPKLETVSGIGVTDIKTTSDATFENYTTKPIYVSTGDYYGKYVNSIGVLKSTDGGETFNSTGLSFTVNQDEILGSLIVADANKVLVGTKSVIKITTNGGTTWTDNFDPGYEAGFGRVAVNGTKAMYAGDFDVFYTNDFNTGNWIAVIESNNSNKHAVTVGEDGEFYVQNLTGQIKKFNTTTQVFANHGTSTTDYNPQGGYNQALVVKNNLIISGSVDGVSSTNNGASWYKSLNGYWEDNESDGLYVHSDHHGLGTLDGTNEFWTVNDGGLSYIDYGTNATNQKPTITYKSEKVIVNQSYTVAINPNADDGSYIIANQDNDAFSKRNGTWFSVAQGDGIQSAVNYNNPDIRYAGNQNGNIIQTSTGFEGELNGNGESVDISGVEFEFPLEMHKTNPNILFAGGDEVYKITDNSGLSVLNLNSGVGKVNSIATHGNSVLVAGDNGIKFSTNSGTSWIAKTSPAGTVNSVDFSAINNDIIYVTVSGYTSGSKVFKSIDGGVNYNNISGDLPNIVMKEVLLKQGQPSEYLFVATELGVYFTTNEGVNWEKLGAGLPNVIVSDIEIHYTNDKLVAATFGRGLWEVNIANATLSNADNLVKENILSVYPNPTINDELNISIKNNNYKYLIYNVVGGIVKEGDVPLSNKINVSNLAKNVYIIKVFNDSEVFTTKFLKGNN